MKVIIAGGRDFEDYATLLHKCSMLFPLGSGGVTVVSGGTRGADALGERMAKAYGMPVERFPADWDKHGKRAGPIRNEEMALIADVLVAFWNGQSRGTKNMIGLALRYGLEIHVYRYAS